MAYLLVGSSRSRCSCDQRSSVNPRATGHYMNYAPEYHKSAEPCDQPWDYYVVTYASWPDGPQPYAEASVPFKADGV